MRLAKFIISDAFIRQILSHADNPFIIGNSKREKSPLKDMAMASPPRYQMPEKRGV